MIKYWGDRVDKLIIIDGNSIANRAFYALPLLSNSSGLHTNAVLGFTTMLMRLIDEEKPTHMLVAFDAGKITFRHKEYTDYKGGRAKTPPELSEQFPLIRELIDSFSIARFELDGYEADDIIGTLTRMADERNNIQVIVVSGDKDMLQLASEQVTIAITRKGISEVEHYDPAHIREVYNLAPHQIIDLKGLMGDASDNIPGIPGVGEKTALKLLHEYGSVENVLEHASELKGKLQEKVSENKEDALKSKVLATIYREVPMDQDWESVKYDGFDSQSVGTLFRKLEFKQLLGRMDLPEHGEDHAELDEIKYEIVTSTTVAAFAEQLAHVEAIHVEVTGENPHVGDVLGLALYSSANSYFLPMEVLECAEAEPIRSWLSDGSVTKSIYDTHKAEVALAWKGIILRGIAFDVLLAAYLLDPTDLNLTLAGISRKYGQLPLPEDDEIFGKGAKFNVPEVTILGQFMCRKVVALHRLNVQLKDELKSSGMDKLFYDLELPLATLLSRMELQGIRVNTEGLKKFGEQLVGRISELEQQVHELAGSSFNINSPKQLGEVLFDKLGLPVWKKTKTGYSTDAEVLEKLEPYHEIIPKILLYRQLTKLQSTYVEGLLKEVRPRSGKIHTYYRQTIAATGRLSSQFPNLQNIPIRLEEGRKIRKVFVPSEPGWLIVGADYSQIELRVLAHISRDEKMKEAFHNDLDIHTKTAMDVFGVSEDMVDSNMRRQAKAVNFGIVYGISDYGLSQNLNITRKEAAQFIEQYFAVFQGVRTFMDEVVKQAKQDGYVTTLLGRRRYLPEISSSNFNLRSFAERTAMNSPIQGTAADIIKLAMVQLVKRMDQEHVRSRLLLQVHDELVLEVPEDELEQMQHILHEVMESALQLDVPLKVDVSYGIDWYDAK
ncbi:MAG: DNA polymerase I [Paenibacillaceae bacterium]